MVVKLRFKRFGRLNHPTFRLVATESTWKRDGRILETLGFYLPLHRREGEQVKLNTERVTWWLSVGAQPSGTARSLMKKAGIALPVPRRKPRKKTKAAAKKWAPPKKRVPKPKKAAKAAEPKAES